MREDNSKVHLFFLNAVHATGQFNIYNDTRAYVSQVMNIAARSLEVVQQTQQNDAAVEGCSDNEDKYVDSQVLKNKQALAQHMVQNTGLKKMASVVDLKPLNVEDIKSEHTTSINGKFDNSEQENNTEE